MKVQVIGGPHDGAEVTLPIPDFVWCDGRRCFRDPKQGRGLYRKARGQRRYRTTDGVVTKWLLIYVENAYVRCPGCEVYHGKGVENCQLCGSVLVTA